VLIYPTNLQYYHNGAYRVPIRLLMGKGIKTYFMIAMSLVFLGYLMTEHFSEKKTGQPLQTEKKKFEKCIGRDFEVSDFMWHKERSGAGVIIDSLTIKNKGSRDCRNIRANILFFSKTEKKLGVIEFMIEDFLPSKGSKTFRDIRVGNLPYTEIKNASVVIAGADLHL
jgi:hypothetical protein